MPVATISRFRWVTPETDTAPMGTALSTSKSSCPLKPDNEESQARPDLSASRSAWRDREGAHTEVTQLFVRFSQSVPEWSSVTPFPVKNNPLRDRTSHRLT